MANTKKDDKDSPIVHSPVMGYRVETRTDKNGNVIQPSTIANDAAEAEPGRNVDYFESSGRTMEEQNAVGKGVNPSADVVTKNVTTIDPVFIEPSPLADGRVVPETVPASLPVNSPITEPSGDVHKVGQEPSSPNANDGKLVPGETIPGAGLDGKIDPAEIVKPAKIVDAGSDKAAPAAATTPGKSDAKAAPKTEARDTKGDANTDAPKKA